MKPTEQQLLHKEVGTAAIRLQMRTASRIDVGLWWRTQPLWLCITADKLVLLAVGKRRYSESIPLTACYDLHYNPASGELVIPPEDSLRYPRLLMPASKAVEVIHLIQSQPTTSNTPTS